MPAGAAEGMEGGGVTPSTRSDIETALDMMAIALADAGLLSPRIRAAYVRAIRCVRSVDGHRRIRSDAGVNKVEPQMEIEA